MNTHNLQLAVVLVAAFVPRAASAQHEAHAGSASQAPAEMMQCAQVQPVVDSVITGAMTRLESARQSNRPADMRAAVDQLGAALRDIRAQLAPCSAAAADSSPGRTMPGMQPSPGASAAPMDHSKMPMGGTPTPTPSSATGATPATPMDHSKMPMGSAPAAKPGTTTGAKSAAPMDHSKMAMGGAPAAKPGAVARTKPAAPAAPMDHSKMPMGSAPAAKPGTTAGAKPLAPTTPMDHSKMAMSGEAQPGKVMDPVNGLMVDLDTAPKTTYQGRTYYFSSEQSRKEFLANPAKFAQKLKGEGV